MPGRPLFITGLIVLFTYCVPPLAVFAASEENVFGTVESRMKFAEHISSMLARAWGKWQDAVVINDVEIEGSQGFLLPGGLGERTLLFPETSENTEQENEEYIKYVKVVIGAVENGMRSWQRGFSHREIPFPQGASCTFTLTPCDNVPVQISSGSSSGDSAMSEEELYTYMLYRSPGRNEDVLIVLRAVAKAVSECFDEWKESCAIVGITASGGIAPPPSPMGSGAGPVRGAKGNNGRFEGPYLDEVSLRHKMNEYFTRAGDEKSGG